MITPEKINKTQFQTQEHSPFIDMEQFNKARGINKCLDCLEPQRAYNFNSLPADIAFKLENEKWGEVFKFHPVLKVRS